MDEATKVVNGHEVVVAGNAWEDLIAALTLARSKPSANKISPLHCEHDELMVMVDSGDFSAQEMAQLEEWGFHVGEYETLSSFRFGSA